MVNLKKASRELFSRSTDERFSSFDALLAHSREKRERSTEHWQPSGSLSFGRDDEHLRMRLADSEDESFQLNDWSFTQLCKFCGVHKDTVNKLSSETASLVFRDVMPSTRKPLQVFETGKTVAAVHSSAYSRLYDAEVLEIVRDVAPDFTPPPVGLGGQTGLYSGEQDMFAFGIDDTARVEIEGENFAPGFFVWNSEVGKRSVGVQTFWYQEICQNHIVWDAIEVVELKRRHIGDVAAALDDVRDAISQLVKKRDERRDAFFYGIKRAMGTSFGKDADEVRAELGKHGVGLRLADQAIQIANEQTSFSVFGIVDALTRIAGRYKNAGDRLLLDQKAAALLTLSA